MEIAVHKDLPTPVSSSASRRVISTNQSAPQTDDDKKAEQHIAQQEARIIEQLKARDQEVRAHEAAHLAAGRPYIVSGPNYTFQEGPDGRNYAIGGEVHLDTSPVPEDPGATLEKAETVRRAALAPAEPSPQDQRVAATASQTAAQARVEIAVQRREEAELEEPEASKEDQADSIEETNHSEENAVEASTAVEENQLGQNQVKSISPKASVVQAFNVEISEPPTFSQFV